MLTNQAWTWVAHIKAAHEGRIFSCHWAGCDETYTSGPGFRAQLRAVHNPTKLQCSYADCSSVYTSQTALIDHVKKKHPSWALMESTWPMADQECRESFFSPFLAGLHANAVHWSISLNVSLTSTASRQLATIKCGRRTGVSKLDSAAQEFAKPTYLGGPKP